ncbi:MAG: OmpA family protein [Pseudodesulfovibrio sp.]|uniref:OmpA/MotB domain protein n=1 Tax=Pseudodesulfovibrio aespoeensis (strain ATCC 700646 / DSM 10631 / Aspo-2) TaxID=643562 RepID=E6VS45_PSEA9|nr:MULTISPECIES: flagellar motor protein MotB [Pseudodesulfovibrio]MBU4380451.1 OmpA family protein [Pseudomonadota bacterium]ADU63090.1 OmpA/MotB domain protein [Pseudodesulfovibrio aespoeensis Aspo-2]MBU4474134.1 OmpA family protein [Pseudomonadota bacterium]MBU4516798.1 OmpA family protein [Pseudomonadota bacterium]MBU4523116.1 OmpA family protein [Pseudomonadota bacterium]
MSEDYEDILAIRDEEDDTGQEWLTTLADLSMLLLVFFVLLYSMSTIDTEKFSETFSSVTQALQGKLEKVSTSRITQEEAGVLIDQAIMRRQIIESQRKVFAEVKTLQTKKGVEGLVSANFEDGLITIRVPGDVMFGSGQVNLSPKGVELVTALKDFFIQHRDQNIKIIGYTDNISPGKNSRFLDNWEISALRAVNVLRELLGMGIESTRLTATGLAYLNPIYPNTSEEFRAKNRRVEFVLEKRVTGK